MAAGAWGVIEAPPRVRMKTEEVEAVKAGAALIGHVHTPIAALLT